MAFIKDPENPKFTDLKRTLSQSKVTDNALYQTIDVLLEWLDRLEAQKGDLIQKIDNSVNNITQIINYLMNNTATFVTGDDETAALPNSLQVLPGTNITFDKSIPNKLTINSSAGGDYDLDYLGDYTPVVYNNGDIVVGSDGITYVCVKDGTITPPEPWPGSSPGSVIHHTTHEVGGGDIVTVTKLGGYPGGTANFLRADGTFAPPPTGGIPSAHHVTHEPGGSDAIVGAAWLAVNNVFTGANQQISSAIPRVTLIDTVAPADSRVFSMSNTSQLMAFNALNDAQSAAVATPLLLNRGGDVTVGRDVYEKGRSVAMGHWQTVPFNAANFLAHLGGGTWVVGSAAVIMNHYTLIGKTMIWTLYISWFSGANTITGTVTHIKVLIPGGFNGLLNSILAVDFATSGAGIQVDATPTGNYMIMNRRDGGNFTTAPGIIFTLTFGVA